MQAIRVLFFFLLALSVFVLYARHNFTRDPSSVFFDAEAAYKPVYSAKREKEALDFIEKAGQSYFMSPHQILRPEKVVVKKNLCVGVLTSHREGKQHFVPAVGSLLDGLNSTERDEIHLIVFFTNLEPEEHPAYGEKWLETLVDDVLVRKNGTQEYEVATARLEKGEKAQKSTMDYRFLLQTCYNRGTSYVAIIEDDIIATKNWYQMTMKALHKLELQTHGSSDWLYLRMFHTEIFLGWRSEEWGTYIWWIAAAVAMTLASLLLLKRCTSTRSSMPKISNGTLFTIMAVCLPLTIMTYLLCGRLSMNPLSNGIARMDTGGCCSQGLVYPHGRVPTALDALQIDDTNWSLLPDQRIEKAGNDLELSRWAMVPSVLQHVGRMSGDGETVRMTWNMGFERLSSR